MEDRGLLLVEGLQPECLLNDGSPTRLPTAGTRANPLDLTWVSSKLVDRIKWEVEMETLGSEHSVILMKLHAAMNHEEIRVREVEKIKFLKNVEGIDQRFIRSDHNR